MFARAHQKGAWQKTEESLKPVESAPALQPRPEVVALSSAYHGALDYAELEEQGLSPDAVLDFSVNSNPYGPSPSIRDALSQVPLDRYPDRQALALRRALARHLAVSPGQIVAGNGTAELLNLIAVAFVRAGDRVLVAGPTFGEYERSARLMGGQVETLNARPEQDFVFDADALGQKLADTGLRLCFLCRPNNPTGTLPPLDVLETWARQYPRTLFVVDEAYLAFAPGCISALSLGADNILVLRSMTKDYALAGLRLGYAVGSQAVIEAVACACPPWNVNGLAQAAGLAALADQAHLQQSLDRLGQAKKQLVSDLEGLGLAPLPSAVHFFLVPVGNAAAFRSALLRQGILVRDCASFGLPGMVRIATRRPEENRQLVAAVRRVRASAAARSAIDKEGRYHGS
jgi:histidinol-phosphate aminotransferase